MENNIIISKTTKASVILFAIVEVLTVTIPVAILGHYFNFPDILRQPAAIAFDLFKANQYMIVTGYYIFMCSSLVYIPLSYALSQSLKQDDNTLSLKILVGLGITTAIFQCLGFIRWIFVMPYLTQTYFNQPEAQQSITIIYEMLNRYAGMSVGEHLGFIAMGSWTIVLGIVLVKHSKVNAWIGYVGVLIGSLIILSIAEHFGGSLAPLFGTLNFLANTFWIFWLVGLAIVVKRI